AEGFGVALFLDDLEDVGVLLHALHEGVMVDLAEPLGEGDLLLGRDGLLAEEDDEVLEPGGLDLLERRIVQVGEVDAADLGTQRPGEGLYFDATIGAHGPLLHPDERELCKMTAGRSMWSPGRARRGRDRAGPALIIKSTARRNLPLRYSAASMTAGSG